MPVMRSAEGNTTVTEMDSRPLGVGLAPALSLLWVFPLASEPPLPLVGVRDRPLILGREDGSDVRLSGDGVSRKHASLRLGRGDAPPVIEDLGSRNGVRVNGRVVRSASLTAGDVVRLGGWVGVVTANPGVFAEVAPGLWGGAALDAAISPLRRAAPSDLPIVLEGETGTGKEVVARAVHTFSGRPGPMLAVNCAALPEGLAEAELFGYRRGAFTGADRASQGFFRSAERGTLLLDEVSDLPLSIQAKLLRVLEQREVQALGEVRPVPVDVRLIVAGQQSLVKAVQEGRFPRGSFGARGGRHGAFAAAPRAARGRAAAVLALARGDGAGGRSRRGERFRRAPVRARLAVQRARARAARAAAARAARRRVFAARRAPARAHGQRAARRVVAALGRSDARRTGCGDGRTGRAPGARRGPARFGWQRRARVCAARHHPPARLPTHGRSRHRPRRPAPGRRAMSERGERRIGEVVGGKYRICRFLASGGMGAVYEAQHTLVKRRFAVKFLHPDLAHKRDLLARFQREAEAAGALESENVAASVDLGIAGDGSPYIVMEYLVGESLELLLEREGTLPVERVADLVQQACHGVQAAHALGIVHRDLKPHNLFVCRREDGTDLVKVLDFGVAKLEVLEKNSAATRTGTVLGTPSYMSPEQARGEKSVGQAADVYALGAIAYELLSGKKPHPGDSHNAILHHIATQPALPLQGAMPELPEALVGVVEQALAAQPEARPSTADAFAAALAPWAKRASWPPPKLETSAPRQREPSTTELAPGNPVDARLSPAPSLAVAAMDRGRDTTPVRRPPWLFVALGAGAVLLSVAVFVARGRPPERANSAPAAPAVTVAGNGARPIAEPQTVQAPPPLAPPAPSLEARPASSSPTAAPPTPTVAVSRSVPHGARRPASPQARVSPSTASPEAALDSVQTPVTFDQKNPYH